MRVDGEPVELDGAQRAATEDFVRNWYVRNVARDSGRSSTWTSGHMIAALLGPPGGGPWPPSMVLEGEYGIDGVAVSVPVTLGDGGAAAIHEWDLTAEQAAGMQAGAKVVREALAAVDLA